MRPGGETRWVRAHARLVTDHFGQPERFSVHLEDITALFEVAEAPPPTHTRRVPDGSPVRIVRLRDPFRDDGTLP